MDADSILDVANLCLALDLKASEIYPRLAQSSRDIELERFWLEMTEAEKKHIAFWQGAKTAMSEYRLPDLFDDPARVGRELEQLLTRITTLAARWEATRSFGDALALAFRLEFAMAHPAFVMFYHTLGPLVTVANPAESYELHLNHFLQMMEAYGKETPELELLGENLRNLWQTNQALTELVTIDGLTRLLNRRGFFIFANQLAYLAQRNKENIALLILAVDDLHSINDRYGHSKGDRVLKEVADLMTASLRRSDVVARYSGGEFIVLFPSIRSDAVAYVAEKLRSLVEQAEPAGVCVTVSIGVTQDRIIFDPGAELDSLIGRADRCLERAKLSGSRPAVCCE